MHCFGRVPCAEAAPEFHAFIYPNFLFPISLVQWMTFSRDTVKVAKAMYQSTIFGVEVDPNLKVQISVESHKC